MSVPDTCKILAEIHAALPKLATKSTKDGHQKYLGRVVRAASSDLPEADFEKMSKPAQDWVNAGIDAINGKTEIPLPAGYEPAGPQSVKAPKEEPKKAAKKVPVKAPEVDEDEDEDEAPAPKKAAKKPSAPAIPPVAGKKPEAKPTKEAKATKVVPPKEIKTKDTLGRPHRDTVSRFILEFVVKNPKADSSACEDALRKAGKNYGTSGMKLTFNTYKRVLRTLNDYGLLKNPL